MGTAHAERRLLRLLLPLLPSPSEPLVLASLPDSSDAETQWPPAPGPSSGTQMRCGMLLLLLLLWGCRVVVGLVLPFGQRL